MKAIKAIHPPLFALYFPLTLYSVNAGIVPWSDVVAPSLALLGISLLLWFSTFKILKDQVRAAAVTSAFLICFFSHTAALELIFRRAAQNISDLDSALLVGSWVLVALAVIVGAGWKGKHNQYVNQFLNIGSCVIVALVLFSIGSTTFKRISFRPLQQGTLANATAKMPEERPDVFYIILDGYGSNSTLKQLYSFDNKSFLLSLKERGFYVADDAKSNFCETEISLASSLNLVGIEGLPRPQNNTSLDRMFLDKMVDQSMAAKVFRGYGYNYYAITTGFPSLAFESADFVLEDSGKFSLFLDALLAKTPIRYSTQGLQSGLDRRRDQLGSGFESLKQLAKKGSSPRFIVCHILAPHPPFAFGPNGESVRQKIPFGLWDGNHYMEMGGNLDGYRSGYIGQLQYVNRRILESVDSIKSASPDSIIILQGDHGPKSETDQNDLKKTNLGELFGILYAVRGPEKVQKRLYSSITPINTFRIVLSELFGLNLKLAEDKSYFSGWEHPLVFEDVTERLK